MKIQKLTGFLLVWFSRNARDLPWRRTRDPYAIWVSEIMLQQTQVKTVIPYWERWMRELPTLQAAAKTSPARIHKLWEGLGYYTRVRNLQKAAKQIVAQHDARSTPRRRRGNESQTKKELETPHVVSYKFPNNFEDVLALPGVGRYTAGAICSIAFNQPTPILDGNVIRVLTRVFGIGENPREKKTNAQLWQLAEQLVVHASRFTHHVPHSKPRTRDENEDEKTPACSFLNQSLMELGALVCTPRNPQCGICPARKLCVAFRENCVEEFPNLDKRATATARHYIAFVIERNGRFLVRQRPAGVVNGHLWEFPNIEIGAQLPARDLSESQPQHARLQKTAGKISAIDGRSTGSVSVADIATQLFGSCPANLNHLCTVKHSITRYRITLETWHVSFITPQIPRIQSVPPSERGVWLSPAQMNQLAFTSAHKKLASAAANCILSDR